VTVGAGSWTSSTSTSSPVHRNWCLEDSLTRAPLPGRGRAKT
jgi:hypothetical protein